MTQEALTCGGGVFAREIRRPVVAYVRPKLPGRHRVRVQNLKGWSHALLGSRVTPRDVIPQFSGLLAHFTAADC